MNSSSAEGYYRNRDEEMLENINWSFFADLLDNAKTVI